MAKGIRGKDIYKLKRIDDNTIIVEMKNGKKIKFVARMVGYDECALVSCEIDDESDYSNYGDEW